MKNRWIQFMVRQVLPPVLVLIAAAVAMQVYVSVLHVPPYRLPLPTEVVRRLIDDHSDLLAALWNTSQAALIGFAASAIIGVAVAMGLAASPLVRRAFYPYTLFFQTVPIIAIAPLLVIWFDYGLKSVAISAFIVSVFPVIANTLAGLLSTDPALVDLFHLYGAGPVDRLWKLRLPYALPDIITGLRISAGLAVIGTIVSEFLVGQIMGPAGLGVTIVSSMRYGHTDRMFAAVLLASLLGLGLFAAVNFAGHVLLRRWHASERGD